MSCNRENVTWKGRDGKWNIGFFDFYSVGDQDDPEWDYEWDVEYEDYFMWASIGHSSPDEAYQQWDGANPGGTTIYDEPSEITDRFDKLAADIISRNPPRRLPQSVWFPR